MKTGKKHNTNLSSNASLSGSLTLYPTNMTRVKDLLAITMLLNIQVLTYVEHILEEKVTLLSQQTIQLMDGDHQRPILCPSVNIAEEGRPCLHQFLIPMFNCVSN